MWFTRKLLVAIALTTALPGMTSLVAAQDQAARITWWSGPGRDARINQIVDMFEKKNPGTKIQRETATFSEYMERLATQTAAGTAPDVVQFPYHTNAAVYADRRVLLPLQEYVDKKFIELTNIDKVCIEGSTYNGKLMFVPLGASFEGVLYNESGFSRLGIAVPEWNWSWDDFIAKGKEIAVKAPKGTYAVADKGGDSVSFLKFILGRGKKISDGDKFGFDKEDLKAWLAMWQTLRDEKVAPPASITSEIPNTFERAPIATGLTLMEIRTAHEVKLLQPLVKDTLAIANMPQGKENADFINQTWFAIHQNSKNPELAAKLMNHFINDPEVTKIWGMEIGPVCNSEMRKVQAVNYTQGEKNANAAIERYLGDKAFGIGPLPAAFTKMRPFVTEANEKVAFGQATPEQAAEEFFDNQTDIFRK